MKLNRSILGLMGLISVLPACGPDGSTPSDGGNASCERDSECEDGEFCSEGMCLPDVPECEEDADCDGDAYCSDAICVPEGAECARDSNCKADEECDDGACVPMRVVSAECSRDADCDGDEVCAEGVCEAVLECESDSDCDTGERCDEGQCAPVEISISDSTVTSAGGIVTISTTDGAELATLDFPTNAVAEDTPIAVGFAAVPETFPSSLEQAAPALTIDLNGQTLTVPAKARMRMKYDPANETLIVLGYTDNGVRWPQVTLDMEGTEYFAEFDVTEGGDYLVLTLPIVDGCTQVKQEQVTVTSQDDLDALKGVGRINGNLTISGGGITSLEALSCLTQVDGYVTIQNTNLESTEGLDSLALVGSNGQYAYGGYRSMSISNNGLLKSIEMPSLLVIARPGTYNYYYNYYNYYGLSVANNALLEEISMPALNGAVIDIQQNGAAAESLSLSFSALRTAAWVNIANNSSLVDLDGLQTLEHVGGDFTLSGNTSLDDASGLGALRAVTGTLTIHSNLSLKALESFDALRSVGTLALTSNNALTRVTFPELRNVGSDVTTSQGMRVESNTALDTFSADKLTDLPSGLNLRQNGNASDTFVLSFAKLANVGALNVQTNPGLASMKGFEALETAGAVSITGNAGLASLDGLESLETAGSLSVRQNAELLDVDGLVALRALSLSLDISLNAMLASIELPALASLGAGSNSANNALTLGSNPELESVAIDALSTAPGAVSITSNATGATQLAVSFANLVSVSGNLTFTGNGASGSTVLMTSLPALASVAGAFNVSSNPGLRSMDGFETLRSVGGNVSISSNEALTDLDGLSSLRGISQGLTIHTNASLLDLDGLTSLDRVDGAISVQSNAVLSSITLPVLTRLGGGLNVRANPLLSSLQCAALQTLAGQFTVYNNGGQAASLSLSMNALTNVTLAFNIQYNSTLSRLDGFPLLSGVQSYSVTQNISLPTCQAEALRSQIENNGTIAGNVSISGNLSDACSG